ncbi:MAG: GHKL domain-containing protein [Paludibacter sp.]|nr:GHKL domain-containing protein [Paludibacter sp.]
MNLKKSSRLLIYSLLLSITIGLMCDFFYRNSPKNAINIEAFQTQLIQKETEAATTLESLKQIIVKKSVDSLINYSFLKSDISYYVFKNNNMIFWSDNNLDISNISLPDSTDWHYVLLPNAHCVSRLLSFDSVKILALITVKNNYPYENEELVNNFAKGFNIDKQVQIVKSQKSDKFDVFCKHGNYLFSLAESNKPIFNETWSVISLSAYSIAFLLFFLLYSQSPYLIRRKTFNIKLFSFVSLSVGLILGMLLFFNIPASLFQNKLFTAFQYASNPLLASICHLTIVTGYFLATIYLFYSHVNIDKLVNTYTRIALQVWFALYFGLTYYIMSGLVYHSSIQLAILSFSDFSIITIWIHFLILVWGIGLTLLFFKTHHFFKLKHLLKNGLYTDILLTIFLILICLILSSQDAISMGIWFTALWLVLYLPFLLPSYKNIYVFIALWLFMFTAFWVVNSYRINDNLKYEKYKLLAQNIFINGNTENDRMADILLEELDLKINSDNKAKDLLTKPDSLSAANKYLNENYLRGFWNRYEMRLNVVTKNSELYNEYMQYINAVGTKIKKTHFYSVPANENNISYIGAFPFKSYKTDSMEFFMEFYPRRNFKSYSFPNLLISSAPDILTRMNLTIARYENQKLVYSSGNEEYQYNIKWIPKNKLNFFKVIYMGKVHFVLAANASTYIVLTEQQLYNPSTYFLYFIYTFLTYFAFCWLVVWSYQLVRKKRNYRLGLSAKFQYAFISLLIISFLGIFYVSVNFIQKKYRDEQIVNLESKKSYIQKALQDMYYWNQDLNVLNSQKLNFDLQDLSYIYHTDIHVYNNRGVLVGSSQPLIFNKSLISNRISPTPYFSLNPNLNQYEHIGRLNYLTGYSDFYNGDFLQIGYIAIPQFFSQDEIRSEIESFLAVIIHIYLIIIVLAILLSLFIGKQLSAPLNMIENKLKEMRLGRRNEKIDYTLNDEIGQLVSQYNRTIDELEQSANLLAKSERETAWKSMARQVAHEINNPLTPMKLTIQQMQRTKKMNDERFDEYFAKSTDMLIEQIDNLSRIAGTFSNFARMPEANFEKVDIAAKIVSVVQLFSNNNEEIQIKFKGLKRGVYVFADPEQLVQVFNNLLKNAIQSIPETQNGNVQVVLKQIGEKVIIEISDNGTGINPEISDKLFVPNFTTKTTGMGLGLAIAKNIIELSGGTITFTTKLAEGTIFTVSLPNEVSQTSN